MSDSEFIEYVEPSSPQATPPPHHDEIPSSQYQERANTVEYASHIDNGDYSSLKEQPDHLEYSQHVENSHHVENSKHAEQSEYPHPSLRPTLSRRSTIMLTEEELPNSSHQEDAQDEGPFSRAQEGDQVDLEHFGRPKNGLVETVIEWKGGGNSVFVTGSFTGWKQMIPLRKFDDNVFLVVLKLEPGTHRLRFVVDGELRCSDDMNTATDSMGNLVNYMEVSARLDSVEDQDLQPEHDQYLEHEYTRQIPEVFADPEILERFSSIDFIPPPQLPPHLDGVILNTNCSEKDNNSVLPIPNHVVLNHLATTSIKHNVLAVASVSRYKAKYVTQILYTPIEGI